MKNYFTAKQICRRTSRLTSFTNFVDCKRPQCIIHDVDSTEIANGNRLVESNDLTHSHLTNGVVDEGVAA